ncbi:MAG: 5-aminovalerate aminotransferase DavT [Firmicutes bacterium ADurb.Bin153]|mgnify:CR=1 FL=1|nr:MAG: 5-aminovalerate aminotransferase DavT [Firmicutes bacterium ADurb.Bin153]HPU95797.1 aspartate aminotransferase family protein [Bacillota bacterium]
MAARTAEKYAKYMFPTVRTLYEEPIVMSRGSGHYLYDEDGKEYLDFFGGILTCGIGHANPKVAEAVSKQAHTLQHCSTLYIIPGQVELAERLLGIVPKGISKFTFANSGTEAIEAAILMAQIATGNDEIIALRHSYSGRSKLAIELTALHNWKQGMAPSGNVKYTHNGYCYRCAFGLGYPSCGMKCAYDLEELIRTSTRGSIAALIAEPVQGVGGVIVPPPEFFPIVADITRKHGGIFISDEVQTGFGRTGGKWFGIEHWGVEPDAITAAKQMASGAPIGALMARAELADRWTAPSISTFGGNPVTMAAACATIDFMKENDTKANAEAMGARLTDGLSRLQRKYPCMGDVRGKGLMIGIEFVKEGKEPAAGLLLKVLEGTKRRGLLVGKGGLDGNVMRLAPHLTITQGEIDGALSVLEDSIAEA